MASLVAALCISACGGGEPSTGETASTTKVALRIEPPPQHAKAIASAPSVAAPLTHDSTQCLQQVGRLAQAPRKAGNMAPTDFSCLLGVYLGRTPNHEHCALTVGSRSEQPRLMRQDNQITLELARASAQSSEGAMVTSPVDIGMGQAGLEFRQRSRDGSGTRETLVLTAGARDEHSPGKLNDMVYERAENDRVIIVRCEFDG